MRTIPSARMIVLALVGCCAALLSGCLGRTANVTWSNGHPVVKHVWVIVEDSGVTTELQNKSEAPFLNTLAQQYVWLNGYQEIMDRNQLSKSIAPLHPALPNMLAMTSGSRWAITSNSLTDFSAVFSGQKPLVTTFGTVEAGRFTTTSTCQGATVPKGCVYNKSLGGPALGTAAINRQGQDGTLVEIKNVVIDTYSRCNQSEWPCPKGDGDFQIDLSDSSWPHPAFVHSEITPLFQDPNPAAQNTYGYLTVPVRGETVNIIGTPFCDMAEYKHSWHSPNQSGMGTCWEVHPIVALWQVGKPEPPDPNLFSLVQNRKLSWQVFAQGMPQNCDRQSTGAYAAYTNPGIFYANVAAACSKHDVGYSGANLPGSNANLTFIIPDQSDTMGTTAVAEGDTYLSQIVPRIMKTSAYKSGGVIFIVWDQTSPISFTPSMPAVVISPLVKKHYVSTTAYTHYALLHTIEALLGTGTTGRNDASAPIISGIWANPTIASSSPAKSSGSNGSS